MPLRDSTAISAGSIERKRGTNNECRLGQCYWNEPANPLSHSHDRAQSALPRPWIRKGFI